MVSEMLMLEKNSQFFWLAYTFWNRPIFELSTFALKKDTFECR